MESYCPNRSPLRSWDYLVSNLVILVLSFVISKKHGGAYLFSLCIYHLTRCAGLVICMRKLFRYFSGNTNFSTKNHDHHDKEWKFPGVVYKANIWQISIGECPSNSPFLKNKGAETPKGLRPIDYLRNGEIRGHSPT